MSAPLRRLLVLLLVTAFCAACGVGPESSARPFPPEDVPRGLLVGPTGSPQPAGPRVQQLVFVRESRLVRVQRPVAEVTPRTVLADLFNGPLPDEGERGLTTALPTGAEVPTVDVQDGVASVSLSPQVLDSGRDDQVIALAQVVLSLAALPEVDEVRFVQDGVPIEVPRADGEVTTDPLREVDYGDLLDVF